MESFNFGFFFTASTSVGTISAISTAPWPAGLARRTLLSVIGR